MTTIVWNGNAAFRRRLIPIGDLRPHPRNPRRGVVPEIQKSLQRFGQQRTILALPDRTIVAGHHVWKAAQEEGWTHVAVDHSDLTDDEVEAYLLADNRLSDIGFYDDATLVDLLRPLSDQNALDGTGYSARDVGSLITELLRVTHRDDADSAPPRPTDATSRSGDVYQLGQHTLVCGDATDPDAYAAALGVAQADMVWTDPPYGVDVVGGSRSKPKEKRRSQGHRSIQNDALSDGDLRTLLQQSLRIAYDRTRPGGSWYVAGPAGDKGDTFAEVLRALAVRRHTLIWVKDTPVLSRQDYHYQHETVFYGWRDGGQRVQPPDRRQTSILAYPRPARSSEHPTMKPVALIEQCIRNSSRHGDLILDPFAGSGSTMIACENLERRAALIEIDPIYCDVIRKRYADYTGRPELAP